MNGVLGPREDGPAASDGVGLLEEVGERRVVHDDDLRDVAVDLLQVLHVVALEQEGGKHRGVKSVDITSSSRR